MPSPLLKNQSLVYPKSSLTFLLKYVVSRKYCVVFYLLLISLGVLALNLGNWLFSQIIEIVKDGVSLQVFETALKYLAGLAVCLVVGGIVPMWSFLFRQHFIYMPLERQITEDALTYLQGHSCRYVSEQQTGTLVNKIGQIETILPVFSIVFVSLWTIVCELVIKSAILLSINFKLAVWFLGCTIAAYFLNIIINKKAERLSKLSSRLESLLAGRLVDIIANVQTVKLFAGLNFEKSRLSVLLKQQFDVKKDELKVGLRAYTAMGLVINICSISLIVFALYLWGQGEIGLGDIVFVLFTVNTGFNYLIEFFDNIRNARNRLASIQEGLKPFLEPHDTEETGNEKSLQVEGGKIEFKNISFAYDGKNNVFEDFSLTIKAKEKIGVVGLSGSGKTTLINLLQRAYWPQKGEILIDGQNIGDVSQFSLHNNIALVPQETMLFHRSLKENILFAKPDAGEAEMLEAAKEAYADDFIREFPDGYKSVVGDRGCKLSGGQRQRVAIARAILKNSPILILDEATSALDSESEIAIAQAVSNLIVNKTVIAVAHRLSTLKEMDRIVVLDKGKIAEEGTYYQLKNKKGGLFAELCKMQKIDTEKKDD